MFLLTSHQIKDWDQYTIQHEPVASIELMERAAQECFRWIDSQKWQQKKILVFCGKGNNGGDGLVIARLLSQKNYAVSVYILEFGKPGSKEFQTNLQRLHDLSFFNIHFIQEAKHFPDILFDDIVIDALFGSGLNRPLDGLPSALVRHINKASATVVSIDLPSGLLMDASSKGHDVIVANYTLTFQSYKLALIIQENAGFVGDVQVLNIGLHPGYFASKEFEQQVVEETIVRSIYKPRNRFSHKGAYGHGLLVAGSYGKMGAAVLAAKACIHTGIGLLTCNLPKCGYIIMQTAVPEAMVVTGDHFESISYLPETIEKYDCIGIGPGIGTTEEAQKLISFIVRRCQKPLVIDADGLNCLSLQTDLLTKLPPFSVLTPHPKEFDRLFGNHENDFERIESAKNKSKELNCIIVLKGHHTMIATPAGQCYFNNTGNAGMAKGGSGDVLTGIITSLIAQHYSPLHATILGVYIHGMAGDLAAKALSEEFFTPGNLIRFISGAFLKLKNANRES